MTTRPQQRFFFCNFFYLAIIPITTHFCSNYLYILHYFLSMHVRKKKNPITRVNKVPFFSDIQNVFNTIYKQEFCRLFLKIKLKKQL